jgi:hypothetical protein
MAKVQGAMFGLRASGAFADTVVYGRWKGIPWARQHVTPSNPRTAAQQEVRGALRDAVEEWRTGPYTQADRDAWDLRARYLPGPMSGFNAFVRAVWFVVAIGQSWKRLFQVTATPGAAGQATVKAKATNGDGEAAVLWGYAPNGLFNRTAMTWSAGTSEWQATVSGTAGARFYFRVVAHNAEVAHGSSHEPEHEVGQAAYGITGIYSARFGS